LASYDEDELSATNPTQPSEKRSEGRFAVLIRVVFFIASVFIGLIAFQNLLLPLFGSVITGTIGLFATGLLANAGTMRLFDRRNLTDIGLATRTGSGRNFVLGILLGAGGAAFILVAPLLAGTGHLVWRPELHFSWGSLVFYLAALVFGAAGEEMIFRGYAFQILIEKIGPFATVLPFSVLFGFAHSFNPNVTQLGLLNTGLWGFLLGFGFLRSRDLWLPIGLHYGWNAVLPLFGVNLSGLTIDVTRYVYRWDLPPIWSGGAYGPEGGLLTTIITGVLFAALLKVPVVPQPALIAPVLNDPDF
jgi:uncharacterized protein